jgi:hypothetical protein
MGSNPLRH